MTGTDLLAASRRERDLYGSLLAVYAGLRAALADEAVPVDPAWLAGEHARGERLAGELRSLAAALAPHRLTGAAVTPEVRDLWRASAQVAADAAAANRDCAALARARQAAIAGRLAELSRARRGLAAYRPASFDRARLADASA